MSGMGKHFEQVIGIEMVQPVIFRIDVDTAQERKERRVPFEHESAKCFWFGSMSAELDAPNEDLPKSLLMQRARDDSDLRQVGYGEMAQDCLEHIEIQGWPGIFFTAPQMGPEMKVIQHNTEISAKRYNTQCDLASIWTNADLGPGAGSLKVKVAGDKLRTRCRIKGCKNTNLSDQNTRMDEAAAEVATETGEQCGCKGARTPDFFAQCREYY